MDLSIRWTNRTAFQRGQLHQLSGFGAAGLPMPLGGQTSATADGDDNRTTIDNFLTLGIFDIASDTWHIPRTSGEYPQGRIKVCSIGIQGDKGTDKVRTVHQTGEGMLINR